MLLGLTEEEQMSNEIEALENELNEQILAGKGMEAFEKLYADDVEMQENQDERRRGKDACRAYEEQYFSNIAEFHGAKLGGVAVSGDRSFSEWSFDATFKDGTRMANDQVAARTWRDGKVVCERFFYTPHVVTSES